MSYSVVIPAYNAAATLRETLASVLAQSVPPERVIVVDDGSTDGTEAIARGYGQAVSCIVQDNAGCGAATTRGLDAVETPIVATLDADDLWLPEKAERQLAHLAANPEIDAVFCHMRLFSDDEGDSRAGTVAPGWGRSTMTMRTAMFAKVGAVFDPPGRRGDLVDWLARARETGHRLHMQDEVHALRRIRKGSLSDGRDAVKDRGYVHAAWRAIQRRRNQGI